MKFSGLIVLFMMLSLSLFAKDEITISFDHKNFEMTLEGKKIHVSFSGKEDKIQKDTILSECDLKNVQTKISSLSLLFKNQKTFQSKLKPVSITINGETKISLRTSLLGKRVRQFPNEILDLLTISKGPVCKAK